jgi:predicted transcriptional regulator
LEAFGPQTVEELAERVGYSRVRDYRRKHLEPLIELGLVVEHEGRYGLATNHLERVEEVRNTRYSTERKRRVRRHDPTSGRIVCEVRENGTYLSELERAKEAKDKHADEREKYRYHLVLEENIDAEIEELLNDWNEEQGSYLVAA